ncbi:hypothetical protein AMTRI_Chr04g181590 [Amborella trichopoda]
MAFSVSLIPSTQINAFSRRPLVESTFSLQTCTHAGFNVHCSKTIGNKIFRILRASAITKVGSANDEIKENNSVNPIIVIDDYYSFTYNLCQYLGELGAIYEVRNVELSVIEIKRRKPRGILLSCVLELRPEFPLLGVCMGLQCIGEAYGGKIVRSLFEVMHGKSSLIYYDEKREDGLLSGLSDPFIAGRYHSLVIENENFPCDQLEITAWTEDGLIMAVRQKEYKYMQGVQFHPESIITTEGKRIVRNFIGLIEQAEAHLKYGLLGA